MSQKFVPLISCAITFDQTSLLYRVRVFRISVTSFPPLFFLSHSVAVAAWSGIQRVEPQMIYCELFYHLVRRSHLWTSTSFYSQIYNEIFLSKFSFYLRWENTSKGFIKFCKLISNLILGQIIVSNLTNVHKLAAETVLDVIKLVIKKQTSNTIITLAYHSRCSSWKVSSKASIASDFATLLRIKQGEKRKRCHPKSDFRLWQATHFSTKNSINKPAMNNRRLSIAAVFHFVHPVEKDIKKKSWHKTLSASVVKVNKFQDAA